MEGDAAAWAWMRKWVKRPEILALREIAWKDVAMEFVLGWGLLPGQGE